MTQVVLRHYDGRWIVKVHEMERVFADETEAMRTQERGASGD